MSAPGVQFTSVYPPPPKKTTYEEVKSMTKMGHFPLSEDNSRQIHVGLESVPCLLDSVEKNTEILSDCEALWVESPDEADLDSDGFEKPKAFAKKCEALSRLLNVMAMHGRLQRFDWTWEPGNLDCGQPEVPAKVWTSLAANGRSLKSLNITPTMQKYGECYEASWAAFPSNQYSALRHLNLGLERAHTWDGSKLHQMLKGLKGLTSLHLRTPLCCGLDQFALASHHPGLRSFTLQATIFPNSVLADDLLTQDFLNRHPLIEYLDLKYTQDVQPADGVFQLNEGALPILRAASVILSEPLDLVFSERPIEALQLAFFPGPSDIPKLPTTLKYMSLCPYGTYSLRRDLPRYPQVLAALPALTELQIDAQSSDEPFNEEDLVHFLDTLSSAPGCVNSLTALSFVAFDSEPLAQSFLADLSCTLPPSLKYLSWEVPQQKKLYELIRADGKVTAVEIEPLWPPTARSLFIDEAILDHFGESARDW